MYWGLERGFPKSAVDIDCDTYMAAHHQINLKIVRYISVHKIDIFSKFTNSSQVTIF